MAKTNTRDIDKGFKRIMRELAALEKKPHVKVGLQSNTASKPKKSSQDTPSHTDVLTVGLVHEFGNDRNPERSFMRLTHDMTREDMVAFISTLKDQVFLGRKTVKTSLNLIGLRGVNDIKNTFKNTPAIWPANAPSTIQKKKSSKPLVDTAQLMNSNTHKVVMR